jgi:hypothetical protein
MHAEHQNSKYVTVYTYLIMLYDRQEIKPLTMCLILFYYVNSELYINYLISGATKNKIKFMFKFLI